MTITTSSNAFPFDSFRSITLDELAAVQGGFSFLQALAAGAQGAGLGAATGGAIGVPVGAAIGGFATSPALGVGALPGALAGGEIGAALGGTIGWLGGIGTNIYDQLTSSPAPAPTTAPAATR
jgi:hypothetical protein